MLMSLFNSSCFGLLLLWKLLEHPWWFVTETKEELHQSAWWLVVTEMRKEERLNNFSTSDDRDGLLPEMKVKNQIKNEKNDIFKAQNNRFSVVGSFHI